MVFGRSSACSLADLSGRGRDAGLAAFTVVFDGFAAQHRECDRLVVGALRRVRGVGGVASSVAHGFATPVDVRAGSHQVGLERLVQWTPMAPGSVRDTQVGESRVYLLQPSHCAAAEHDQLYMLPHSWKCDVGLLIWMLAAVWVMVATRHHLEEQQQQQHWLQGEQEPDRGRESDGGRWGDTTTTDQQSSRSSSKREQSAAGAVGAAERRGVGKVHKHM